MEKLLRKNEENGIYLFTLLLTVFPDKMLKNAICQNTYFISVLERNI